MVQAPNVDRQRSSELFRLLIDGPINLRSQVAFDTLAVGWQHSSNHAQLFDRAPQLLHRRLRILNRDQSIPLILELTWVNFSYSQLLCARQAATAQSSEMMRPTASPA